MIYGNKFKVITVSETNFVLEQEISNINNILLESGNSKINFSDMIKKIVNKVCDFIAKIIDKISLLFKKAIPKLYEAVQKLILKIKKSNVNYQGIKDIELILVKPEVEKEIDSFKDIFNISGGLISRYEMAHRKFNDEVIGFINKYEKYHFDKQKCGNELNNIIIRYNNEVNDIHNKLTGNFGKYTNYWSSTETGKLDINRFFKKESVKIESVKDYENVIKSLNEQLNGNKSSTATLAETVRELSSLSKRLKQTADDIYKSDKDMEEKAREIFGTKDSYFTYLSKNNIDFSKDPDENDKRIANNWGYKYFSRQEFDEIADRKISSSAIGFVADKVPKVGAVILKVHVGKIKYLIKAYNEISKSLLNESLELDEVDKTIKEIIE